MPKRSERNPVLLKGGVVHNLITQVQHYEGDTFSASESGVDRGTAEQISAWLIWNFLFEEDGMPGDCIDGAVLTATLENLTGWLPSMTLWLPSMTLWFPSKSFMPHHFGKNSNLSFQSRVTLRSTYA